MGSSSSGISRDFPLLRPQNCLMNKTWRTANMIHNKEQRSLLTKWSWEHYLLMHQQQSYTSPKLMQGLREGEWSFETWLQMHLAVLNIGPRFSFQYCCTRWKRGVPCQPALRVSEKQLHFPEAGLANSLVHTYLQGGAGGMTVGLVDLELEVPPFCTIQPSLLPTARADSGRHLYALEWSTEIG